MVLAFGEAGGLTFTFCIVPLTSFYMEVKGEGGREALLVCFL